MKQPDHCLCCNSLFCGRKNSKITSPGVHTLWNPLPWSGGELRFLSRALFRDGKSESFWSYSRCSPAGLEEANYMLWIEPHSREWWRPLGLKGLSPTTLRNWFLPTTWMSLEEGLSLRGAHSLSWHHISQPWAEAPDTPYQEQNCETRNGWCFKPPKSLLTCYIPTKNIL